MAPAEGLAPSLTGSKGLRATLHHTGINSSVLTAVFKEIRISFSIKDSASFKTISEKLGNLTALALQPSPVTFDFGGVKFEGVKVKEIKTEGTGWKVDKDGCYPDTIAGIISFHQ